MVPSWHKEKPERLVWIMDAMNSLNRQYPNHILMSSDFPPITK